MGWFTRDTDSDKASSTENTNNASYKEGYDMGKGGDLISDIAQELGFNAPGTANSNSFNNGYEAGVKDR